MTLRITQFVAILLTAIALVPGGAHLLELPNKIGLDKDHYLAVQVVYRGWALLGFVLFGALFANLLLAILSRGHRPAMLFAAGATALMLVSLAIFFTWTFPVNQATSNWTVAPSEWRTLRSQWEYSHAANCVVMGLALCSVVLSALTRSDEASSHWRGTGRGNPLPARDG
jgi:hypothetical protein